MTNAIIGRGLILSLMLSGALGLGCGGDELAPSALAPHTMMITNSIAECIVLDDRTCTCAPPATGVGDSLSARDRLFVSRVTVSLCPQARAERVGTDARDSSVRSPVNICKSICKCTFYCNFDPSQKAF